MRTKIASNDVQPPGSACTTRDVASGVQRVPMHSRGSAGPLRTFYPPMWSSHSEFSQYTYEASCSQNEIFQDVRDPQLKLNFQPGPHGASLGPLISSQCWPLWRSWGPFGPRTKGSRGAPCGYDGAKRTRSKGPLA